MEKKPHTQTLGAASTTTKRKEKIMANDTIAWLGVRTDSAAVTACLRRVLSEMAPWALLFLRDKRLQVEVVEDEGSSVWAYFPVHRRRLIARSVQLKPTTRVLLRLSRLRIEKQPRRLTRDELRDHLGHTLLYLRSPHSRNDCEDALREWNRACKREGPEKKPR